MQVGSPDLDAGAISRSTGANYRSVVTLQLVIHANAEVVAAITRHVKLGVTPAGGKLLGNRRSIKINWQGSQGTYIQMSRL